MIASNKFYLCVLLFCIQNTLTQKRYIRGLEKASIFNVQNDPQSSLDELKPNTKINVPSLEPKGGSLKNLLFGINNYSYVPSIQGLENKTNEKIEPKNSDAIAPRHNVLEAGNSNLNISEENNASLQISDSSLKKRGLGFNFPLQVPLISALFKLDTENNTALNDTSSKSRVVQRSFVDKNVTNSSSSNQDDLIKSGVVQRSLPIEKLGNVDDSPLINAAPFQNHSSVIHDAVQRFLPVEVGTNQSSVLLPNSGINQTDSIVVSGLVERPLADEHETSNFSHKEPFQKDSLEVREMVQRSLYEKNDANSTLTNNKSFQNNSSVETDLQLGTKILKNSTTSEIEKRFLPQEHSSDQLLINSKTNQNDSSVISEAMQHSNFTSENNQPLDVLKKRFLPIKTYKSNNTKENDGTKENVDASDPLKNPVYDTFGLRSGGNSSTMLVSEENPLVRSEKDIPLHSSMNLHSSAYSDLSLQPPERQSTLN